MTPRERKVYEFIAQYLELHGHSPRYKEILGAVGIKYISNISYVVTNLIRKNYLSKLPNKKRGLMLVQEIESVDGDGA